MPGFPILLTERTVLFEAFMFIPRIYWTVTLRAVPHLDTYRLPLQLICFMLLEACLAPERSVRAGFAPGNTPGPSPLVYGRVTSTLP